ncbi:MAG: hypothetical protein A7316_08615 [Candidatus Altiarchaeales archaeon WOR_SM1_86-2]|nr:MAG: hypothetical protein A7316_08615 [Candidatus Altiarchaeales archaeon WOR_SM1_86-2]
MKKVGSIIIYRLTELNQIERDKFCRKLLGRIVKTHRGKYTHHIKGILDTVPHIHVGRGILIVEKTNKQMLSDFFRDHGVKNVFIRDLILTKSDICKLKNEKQSDTV